MLADNALYVVRGGCAHVLLIAALVTWSIPGTGGTGSTGTGISLRGWARYFRRVPIAVLVAGVARSHSALIQGA